MDKAKDKTYYLSSLLFSKDSYNLISHYLDYNLWATQDKVTNHADDKSLDNIINKDHPLYQKCQDDASYKATYHVQSTNSNACDNDEDAKDDAKALAKDDALIKLTNAHDEFYLPALGDFNNKAPKIRTLLSASLHYFENYDLTNGAHNIASSPSAIQKSCDSLDEQSILDEQNTLDNTKDLPKSLVANSAINNKHEFDVKNSHYDKAAKSFDDRAFILNANNNNNLNLASCDVGKRTNHSHYSYSKVSFKTSNLRSLGLNNNKSDKSSLNNHNRPLSFYFTNNTSAILIDNNQEQALNLALLIKPCNKFGDLFNNADYDLLISSYIKKAHESNTNTLKAKSNDDLNFNGALDDNCHNTHTQALLDKNKSNQTHSQENLDDLKIDNYGQLSLKESSAFYHNDSFDISTSSCNHNSYDKNNSAGNNAFAFSNKSKGLDNKADFSFLPYSLVLKNIKYVNAQGISLDHYDNALLIGERSLAKLCSNVQLLRPMIKDNKAGPVRYHGLNGDNCDNQDLKDSDSLSTPNDSCALNSDDTSIANSAHDNNSCAYQYYQGKSNINHNESSHLNSNKSNRGDLNSKDKILKVTKDHDNYQSKDVSLKHSYEGNHTKDTNKFHDLSLLKKQHIDNKDNFDENLAYQKSYSLNKSNKFKALLPQRQSYSFTLSKNQSLIANYELKRKLNKLSKSELTYLNEICFKGHYALSVAKAKSNKSKVIIDDYDDFCPYVPIDYQSFIKILNYPVQGYWGSYQAFVLYAYLGRFLNSNDLLLKDVMVGNVHVPLVIGSPTGLVLLTSLCSESVHTLLDVNDKEHNLLYYLNTIKRAGHNLQIFFKNTLLAHEDKSVIKALNGLIYLGVILDNCSDEQLLSTLKERTNKIVDDINDLEERLEKVNERLDLYQEFFGPCDFAKLKSLYEPYYDKEHLPDHLNSDDFMLVQLFVFKDHLEHQLQKANQTYNYYLELNDALDNMKKDNICLSQVDPYTLSEFLHAKSAHEYYDLYVTNNQDTNKQSISLINNSHHEQDQVSISEHCDHKFNHDSDFACDNFIGSNITKFNEFSQNQDLSYLKQGQSTQDGVDANSENTNSFKCSSFYDENWRSKGYQYLHQQYGTTMKLGDALDTYLKDKLSSIDKMIADSYQKQIKDFYHEQNNIAWMFKAKQDILWLACAPFKCDFTRCGFVQDCEDEQYLFNMLGLKANIEMDDTLCFTFISMLKNLKHDCYPDETRFKVRVLKEHYEQHILDCARTAVQKSLPMLNKRVQAISDYENYMKAQACFQACELLKKEALTLFITDCSDLKAKAYQQAALIHDKEQSNRMVAHLCADKLKSLGINKVTSMLLRQSLSYSLNAQEHFDHNIMINERLLKAANFSSELAYSDGTWAQSHDFVGQDSLNYKYFFQKAQLLFEKLSYEDLYQEEYNFLKVQANYQKSIEKSRLLDEQESLEQDFKRYQKRKAKDKDKV